MRKHKNMISENQANEFLKDLKGTTKCTITGTPINAYKKAVEDNDFNYSAFLMGIDINLFNQFFRACKEFELI